MAAHFSARVYGAITGTPPYTDTDGSAKFDNASAFNYAPLASFPVGATIFPLANGVNIGNAYVYSVINVSPSGLNQAGQAFVTDSLAATLASAIG